MKLCKDKMTQLRAIRDNVVNGVGLSHGEEKAIASFGMERGTACVLRSRAREFWPKQFARRYEAANILMAEILTENPLEVSSTDEV